MNEQKLKDKIKNISRQNDCAFSETWKLLILERFLVRLAHSAYYRKFVFKGGLLLSKYLFIGRETSDIDLLAKEIEAISPQIEKAMMSICNTPIQDGFQMAFSDIEELDHAHMNYPGFRVKLNIQLGSMKDRIQVDVGVGDLVNSKYASFNLIQYKGGSIFEGDISLQVYPVETIFAEKLECIISRGSANSRMKDFHDILLLCREENLINVTNLKKDIENTFRNRQTKKEIPIKFNEDELARLQAFWVSHLRSLGGTKKTLNLPSSMPALVGEINTWFSTHQL